MFSSTPLAFIFRTVSFRSRILPHNSVWMEDAKLKGLEICHPQVRRGATGELLPLRLAKERQQESVCICVFVKLRRGTSSTGSLEVS